MPARYCSPPEQTGHRRQRFRQLCLALRLPGGAASVPGTTSLWRDPDRRANARPQRAEQPAPRCPLDGRRYHVPRGHPSTFRDTPLRRGPGLAEPNDDVRSSRAQTSTTLRCWSGVNGMSSGSRNRKNLVGAQRRIVAVTCPLGPVNDVGNKELRSRDVQKRSKPDRAR